MFADLSYIFFFECALCSTPHPTKRKEQLHFLEKKKDGIKRNPKALYLG